MLKIEKQTKRLTPLQEMPAGSLAERYDLAELISNSPAEFFAEAQLELFVVSNKLSISDALPLRADLLALDKDGRAVIVATRQGKQQADPVKPIACAAIIAEWTPEKFLEQLSDERRKALKTFLHVGAGSINREQSVILVAEDYNETELTAVKWLREQHNIDIRCLCVVTAVDSEENEYLSCKNLTQSSLKTTANIEMNSELNELPSINSEIQSSRLAS